MGTHAASTPTTDSANPPASPVAVVVWTGTTKLAGRGLARLTHRYHQRLAHTIETPI